MLHRFRTDAWSMAIRYRRAVVDCDGFSHGLLMNIVLGIVGAVIASAIFSFPGIALGGRIGYLIAGFIPRVFADLDRPGGTGPDGLRTRAVSYPRFKPFRSDPERTLPNGALEAFWSAPFTRYDELS